MIDELWGSFPRLLEQNINGLLDTAEPNPTKAFQLYKACKNEDVWSEDFEKFSMALRDFYARPRSQRRKSHFDQFLDRPMPSDIFPAFHLNFRTAVVDDRAIGDLASWASNLIRVGRKVASTVASLDVMTKTLNAVTHPGPFDKAENIEFEDFCGVWKKTVSKVFGSRQDREFNAIVTELRQIAAQHKELEALSETVKFPLLQLTPAEVDWIKLVKLAALARAKIPKPLKIRAFETRKQCLRDLDRVIQLYEIVLVTKIEEWQKHQDSTRVTLIERCNQLLADSEPIAA